MVGFLLLTMPFPPGEYGAFDEGGNDEVGDIPLPPFPLPSDLEGVMVTLGGKSHSSVSISSSSSLDIDGSLFLLPDTMER